MLPCPAASCNCILALDCEFGDFDVQQRPFSHRCSLCGCNRRIFGTCLALNSCACDNRCGHCTPAYGSMDDLDCTAQCFTTFTGQLEDFLFSDRCSPLGSTSRHARVIRVRNKI